MQYIKAPIAVVNLAKIELCPNLNSVFSVSSVPLRFTCLADTFTAEDAEDAEDAETNLKIRALPKI